MRETKTKMTPRESKGDATENNINIIASGLAKFFKDDPEKITLWLLTSNPNFGGCAPAEVIAIRGDDGLRKVARFIEACEEAVLG